MSEIYTGSSNTSAIRSVYTIHEPQKNAAPSQVQATGSDFESIGLDAGHDAKLRQAAEDFEAAFVAQMLKFSGLTEALTSGGGEDVAAFTDFYIESFSQEIVESGGFGLADKFYQKLKLQSQDTKET